MTEQEAAEAKAALRKEVFARRKLAHQKGETAALAATTRLLDRIGDARGRIVSGYRPIRTEIDPTSAMTALVGLGARVCVPVIEGPGQPLIFREWTPKSEMVTGEFGAEVPANGAWLEPDVLIAPLVAFDRTGARLGYGGGFYDRTLQLLRAKRPTLAVGFAYAAQEVDAIPTERTDQRLDTVVTEKATLEFG